MTTNTHWHKAWEPGYFRSRFGDATQVVFALPMDDGTVAIGARNGSGYLHDYVGRHGLGAKKSKGCKFPDGGSVEYVASMPVALAILAKRHPHRKPLHTRGQYWAQVA